VAERSWRRTALIIAGVPVRIVVERGPKGKKASDISPERVSGSADERV
jgi:hypothetical protein